MLEDYQILKAKTDEAEKTCTNTPINQRQALLQAFKQWLELIVETNLYMIEVVSRFGPSTAKLLKEQIADFLKDHRQLSTEEYWDSTEYAKVATPENLNKQIRAIFDTTIQAGHIYQKEVSLAFTVVVETLKRTKGKLPLEPEEQLVKALTNYNARLIGKYEGAYQSLESDNPDRYRHCAVSMRQVVDGVLGETAEAREEFMRNHIKTKRESEILNSLARLVRSIDDTWNAGVHSEIQYETAILAIQATELIINYISSIRQGSSALMKTGLDKE